MRIAVHQFHHLGRTLLIAMRPDMQVVFVGVAVLTNREAPAETTPFIELHDSLNEVTAGAPAGVMTSVDVKPFPDNLSAMTWRQAQTSVSAGDDSSLQRPGLEPVRPGSYRPAAAQCQATHRYPRPCVQPR